jgi:hypothetical protein
MLRPHPDTFPVIQGGPDVKIKWQCTRRQSLTTTGVKINNVAHASPTPINDPVMTIKWRGISMQKTEKNLQKYMKEADLPQKCFPPRSQAPLSWSSLEIDQLHPTAPFAAPSHFPFHHLHPRTFIDRIVYGDDCFHVGRLRIVVFASHCSKKLCFRWVDPVSLGEFRYG